MRELVAEPRDDHSRIVYDHRKGDYIMVHEDEAVLWDEEATEG